MNRRLILFFVLLVAIGFFGVWSFERWDRPLIPQQSFPLVPQESSLTPFQRKMFAQGYDRDRVTHRWYNASEAYTNNGCITYNPSLETDFRCRTPLTGGIPDEGQK